MNNIEIKQIQKPIITNEEYNYIYNRYDLVYKNNNYYWEIAIDNKKYYIQGHLEDKNMYLGISMMDIPLEAVNSFCNYIKKTVKTVKKIKANNYLQKIDKKISMFHYRLYEQSNYWKLELPSDFKLLISKMSKKFNYNLQRERRLISEQLGKYIQREYEYEDIPVEIVDKFFKFKEITHHSKYNLTAKEYLRKYFVTNAYTLEINNSVEAILFSCEQTDTVFLENLSYNPDYSKYSLGKILYFLFLELLIKKNKKYLYLGEGHQMYKSWYGGVENKVCNFVEYTSFLDFVCKIIIVLSKKLRI